MKFNSFDLFALIVCSSLCGVYFGIFGMTTVLTDKEMILLVAFNMLAIFFVCTTKLTKDNLSDYFSRHQCEIESRQLGDLQETHRRRILSLKSEHKGEVHHLQGLIHTMHARYNRLEGEYDWMATAYQDQRRAIQEQEDRIDYLECKLQETGHTSPSARQPYSAPSTQIRFAKPPRRSRGSIAAGMPSPLSQVMGAGETEEH